MTTPAVEDPGRNADGTFAPGNQAGREATPSTFSHHSSDSASDAGSGSGRKSSVGPTPATEDPDRNADGTFAPGNQAGREVAPSTFPHDSSSGASKTSNTDTPSGATSHSASSRDDANRNPDGTFKPGNSVGREDGGKSLPESTGYSSSSGGSEDRNPDGTFKPGNSIGSEGGNKSSSGGTSKTFSGSTGNSTSGDEERNPDGTFKPGNGVGSSGGANASSKSSFTGQHSSSERNSDGTFKPGNSVGSDGGSPAKSSSGHSISDYKSDGTFKPDNSLGSGKSGLSSHTSGHSAAEDPSRNRDGTFKQGSSATNPDNFANKPKEMVKELAREGGKHSHDHVKE